MTDKALVDYLHKNGLKISAYASTGKHNCCPPFAGQMEPGSLGFEELDIVSHVYMYVCIYS